MGVIKYVANCFLIKGSDDLNPIFVQLCEILVISSNRVALVVLDCNVLYYFDDHFHSKSHQTNLLLQWITCMIVMSIMHIELVVPFM